MSKKSSTFFNERMNPWYLQKDFNREIEPLVDSSVVRTMKSNTQTSKGVENLSDVISRRKLEIKNSTFRGNPGVEHEKGFAK